MKRIIGILVLLSLMSIGYGQKSIDRLFEKYADNDGFVTVTISGDLLNLIRSDEKELREDHWPGKITEIRILAQEDEGMKIENFYDLVKTDINTRDYEEFMTVKESDQDLRMLVRTDGNIIKEFLLVAGGEDNFIIQVKGSITFEEAEDFCCEAKKDNGRHILSDLN